jgi:hypothetical protein
MRLVVATLPLRRFANVTMDTGISPGPNYAMNLGERTTVPTSSVAVEIRPCVRGKCVIQPAGTPKQQIGTAELRLALQDALSRRSGTQQRVVGLNAGPRSTARASPLRSWTCASKTARALGCF